MEKRYSRYSEFELREEVASLKEKARKAEQMGMINEYAVLERKVQLAEAYLLDPHDFKPGQIYEIKGLPEQTFTIDYLNGVFAWGYLTGVEEIKAFPISALVSQ